MVKQLLLSGAIAATMLTAAAENESYFTDELGEVYGVSDNGCHVAISDTENFKAYLWSYNNPDVFVDITPDPLETADMPAAQRIKGAQAYDVTNDGKTVVGSLLYASGVTTPAYYQDGKWTPLPLHAGSMNTNEAIAITPDGKIIGGYSFINDPSSEIGGRYYPCKWTPNENGVWTLTAYSNIELPDHQGFYPTAMTADGKTIAGTLYCGASATIPALVTDGELKIFNELTEKTEPFTFGGKYLCGNDENGNQIWTTDPNDPRIIYYTEYYIDGWHDDASLAMAGGFQSCDNNGNFYGFRTRVSDVDAEGNATLTTGATIYNINTGEWTDNTAFSGFTCGVGTDLIFTAGEDVLIDGKRKVFEEEYEFDSLKPFAYVSKVSANGGVIGGMCYEINPASGEYQYFPFVLVTDGAFAGVTTVFGGEERACFMVSGRTISVRNADSMVVYDMNGRTVARGASVDVEPGTYVVKAGEVTSKINIR